jgi:hypothetical protein
VPFIVIVLLARLLQVVILYALLCGEWIGGAHRRVLLAYSDSPNWKDASGSMSWTSGGTGRAWGGLMVKCSGTRPTTAMVEVKGLINPDMLVEIESDAVIPTMPGNWITVTALK